MPNFKGHLQALIVKRHVVLISCYFHTCRVPTGTTFSKRAAKQEERRTHSFYPEFRIRHEGSRGENSRMDQTLRNSTQHCLPPSPVHHKRVAIMLHGATPHTHTRTHTDAVTVARAHILSQKCVNGLTTGISFFPSPSLTHFRTQIKPSLSSKQSCGRTHTHTRQKPYSLWQSTAADMSMMYKDGRLKATSRETTSVPKHVHTLRDQPHAARAEKVFLLAQKVN